MNTHDKIDLPPLPEWADRTLQGDWREEIISWAEHAIEADRQRRGEPVALTKCGLCHNMRTLDPKEQPTLEEEEAWQRLERRNE